jgi:hypothetical protein
VVEEPPPPLPEPIHSIFSVPPVGGKSAGIVNVVPEVMAMTTCAITLLLEEESN